jgi:hypothetical protein
MIQHFNHNIITSLQGINGHKLTKHVDIEVELVVFYQSLLNDPQ